MTASLDTVAHRHAIEIANDDIDFMGHVNNAIYLKWVQDAVIGHWRRLAPPEAVAAQLWVALKHEISYRKPTFVDDEVFALTLLTRVHGARAFFDTIIRRGEEVLAEVHSCWCCVNAETLRPERVSPSLIECFRQS